MQIINMPAISSSPLDDLSVLRTTFMTICTELGLKGTILLSAEGINLTLAGVADSIRALQRFLEDDERFASMTFRESLSTFQPFRFMRVKVKKEIITLRQPDVRPELMRAPSVSPQALKQWLDEKRDITVLDTRNDYEVRFGTFDQAQHFGLKDFSEFPRVAQEVTKDKPVVMFCTGGIRCEKTALQLMKEGFTEVYQLEGGILNYFAEVGAEHYRGDCFVFDQRVALNPQLAISGVTQCDHCQGPIPPASNCVTCVTP